MNHHLVNVMMTRHRKGIELYAPKDRLEDMPALEAAVLRKGYLRLDETAEAEHPMSAAARVSGHALAESGLGEGRADLLPAGAVQQGVAFEADAHLAGIANRTSGLLKAEFSQGQELIQNDPRGYSAEPSRVIDDLIGRQSTLRAADVAGELSRVTQHPATFLRLFKEAMQHPDLVVLSEEGQGGEGRIYSTRAQVSLEMDVVDRGVRLALSDHLPGQPQGRPVPSDAILAKVVEAKSLDAVQADALRAATRGPQLNLLQGGSGSGKTLLAGAVAEAHRQAGSDHVFALAPTGTGIGALRAAGEKRVFSASHFATLGEQDQLHLTASSVVVIDDAAQLDAETASRLIGLAEKSGAKLVMMGDPDQPGPFAAGPVYRMIEARTGSIQLGVSHRQRDPRIARALSDIASPEQGNRAAKALEVLDKAGVFRAAGTATAALERVAQDYVADGSEQKIALAWSRSEVDKINAQIRIELDKAIPERVALQGTVQPAGSIAALRPGDRIALSDRYDAAGLRPGSTGEVLSYDEDGIRIRMQSPGSESKDLLFKGEDEGFQYRFAFASTIHGTVVSSHGAACPVTWPRRQRRLSSIVRGQVRTAVHCLQLLSWRAVRRWPRSGARPLWRITSTAASISTRIAPPLPARARGSRRSSRAPLISCRRPLPLLKNVGRHRVAARRSVSRASEVWAISIPIVKPLLHGVCSTRWCPPSPPHLVSLNPS